MSIIVRFLWDGELTSFASVSVDDASQIPNVGDTMWLRESLDDSPKGVALPVVEIAVLGRCQHLFVDRRTAATRREHLDAFGNIVPARVARAPSMETIVFVQRIKKEPTGAPR